MREKFQPVDLTKLGQESEPVQLSPEELESSFDSGRKEFYKNVGKMTLDAVLKHPEAISYRGLLVASSVIAENSYAEGGYQIESSHNMKPFEIKQYSWDKMCAENNVCTEVILDGAEYIPGIIVVSHHEKIGDNPEDKIHNGKALHCCKNCRNLFRALIEKGIMSKQTRIRFVNDESLVFEDENDIQEFKGVLQEDPEKILRVPKLKFKEGVVINEETVSSLPYDEMTMEEFLNLPLYKNDPESEPGFTKPPFMVASGRKLI